MPEAIEDAARPLNSYQDIAGMLDYAVLGPNLSEQDVSLACQAARRYGVGRFTTRPADLDLVVEWLRGSGVPIGAAVSYPYGADTTSAKLFAARDALQRGAKAIETVLNPGKMISRQFRYVEAELTQMAQECHRAGAGLIVDFELAWLAPDLRLIACRIARRAEVDWVRAGTISGPAQYGLDDLAGLKAKLGDSVKVDAGSAVRTFEDAIEARTSGILGFQSADPAPLLEAWTAELKRREAERSSVQSPSPG